MKQRQLDDVLEWVGHPGPTLLLPRLEAFERWLATEAVVAGGIGPSEAAEAWERHVLDSLMFARGFGEEPSSIIDLGTGVGLPGIPLGLLFPRASLVLVDRSGRRLALARRAARVVGLGFVETVQADFSQFEGSADAVVMRASLQPGPAAATVKRALAPGGSGVLGVGLEQIEVGERLLERFPGSEVLDSGRWLHIMTA